MERGRRDASWGPLPPGPASGRPSAATRKSATADPWGAVVPWDTPREAQVSQRANWNQLRFTKSPPGPVNVMNTVCTPVTDLVRFAVTLPHDCQPPVLLTEKLAMRGPV